MINDTHFDLDGDKVQLDYDALLHTAEIAVRLAREDLNECLAKWYDWGNSPTSYEASLIQAKGKDLADATTALYVLREGQSRTQCVVHGKAPVVQERYLNKIAMIKCLRDQLAGFGIGYKGISLGIGLKQTKDMVEAMIEVSGFYSDTP